MTRHATRQVRRSTPFAARLVEAQDAKGITSEALARQIDVGVRLVQRWRAGEGEPTAQNLIRLAAALDREPAWFFEESKAAA